jgi:hypothetical protein
VTSSVLSIYNERRACRACLRVSGPPMRDFHSLSQKGNLWRMSGPRTDKFGLRRHTTVRTFGSRLGPMWTDICCHFWGSYHRGLVLLRARPKTWQGGSQPPPACASPTPHASPALRTLLSFHLLTQDLAQHIALHHICLARPN